MVLDGISNPFKLAPIRFKFPGTQDTLATQARMVWAEPRGSWCLPCGPGPKFGRFAKPGPRKSSGRKAGRSIPNRPARHNVELLYDHSFLRGYPVHFDHDLLLNGPLPLPWGNVTCISVKKN